MAKKKKAKKSKSKKKAKKSKSIYSIYYYPSGRVVYRDHRPTKSELLKIAKRYFDWEEDYGFTELMGDIEICRERLLTS